MADVMPLIRETEKAQKRREDPAFRVGDTRNESMAWDQMGSGLMPLGSRRQMSSRPPSRTGRTSSGLSFGLSLDMAAPRFGCTTPVCIVRGALASARGAKAGPNGPFSGPKG